MKEQKMDDSEIISETTTYELNDVLQDEPELQRALVELGKHVTAYAVLEGGLPSIDEPTETDVLTIVMTSRHIANDWPSEVNEIDVVVDPFDNSYIDSMSYLTWTAERISVGIKLEELVALMQAHPRASTLQVAWVTEDELSFNRMEISNEYWLTKFEVADRLYMLSRYIPDLEFIATKMASFPPPLAPDEKRVLHAENHLVYIATAVKF